MRIRVNKRVTKIEILAEGEEIRTILGGRRTEEKNQILVATIKNPVLITDPWRISQFDSVTRDTLFQLYASYPRIIEYDKVESWWNPTKHIDVWCPSIDTILFAKAMNSVISGSKSIKSVLEIGCGSGFLGKFVLQKLKAQGRPPEELHFVDINPYAIRCAMDNIEEERKDAVVSYSLNRTREELKIMGKYDLVICNPPYIPRPASKRDNPYEGLYLLKELCNGAKEMTSDGGMVLANLSSLCKDQVMPWLEEVMDIEILLKKRIPLKVLPVISSRTKASKEWLRYLTENTGLEIDEEEKSGYRYWHKIHILKGRLR